MQQEVEQETPYFYQTPIFLFHISAVITVCSVFDQYCGSSGEKLNTLGVLRDPTATGEVLKFVLKLMHTCKRELFFFFRVFTSVPGHLPAVSFTVLSLLISIL